MGSDFVILVLIQRFQSEAVSFATSVLGDASVSYTQVYVDGCKWID